MCQIWATIHSKTKSLRTLNDALRPEAASADGSDRVTEAVFFVGLGEVTAAAEGAGGKGKVMQAFAIGQVIGIKP